MKKKRFDKIYIEITNICNLKCSFCPDTIRAKMFMSKDDFRIIAEKIKDYTNLVALHVKGEPLMHLELKEILNICSENDLKVNITTNATLLKENIDVLTQSKAVRQINMSLHSVSQNENINFKEYIEDILTSSDNIINKSNIIISYRLWNLEDIKINDSNVEILEFIGKHYQIDNLVEIAKQNEFVKLKDNVFLNQDKEFKWPSINGNIISDVGKCWGIKNQVAVLVNGDVVPCCLDQNGDIKLGNILKSNFEDIINSEFSKLIIKGFDENKLVHNLCQRCGFRTKF